MPTVPQAPFLSPPSLTFLQPTCSISLLSALPRLPTLSWLKLRPIWPLCQQSVKAPPPLSLFPVHSPNTILHSLLTVSKKNASLSGGRLPLYIICYNCGEVFKDVTGSTGRVVPLADVGAPRRQRSCLSSTHDGPSTNTY